MDIDPATKELCRVFATTVSLLGRLSTFYTVATSGLHAGAKRQMEANWQIFVQMYQSGELSGFLKEPDKVDEYINIVKQKLPELLQNTLNTAQSSVDAACIVFAHSILDACVYGYLTVTSLSSPWSWECYVERKKIELRAYKTQSYKDLLNAEIQDLLKSKVERESLLYKLDLLHKIAPPKGDKWISMGYSYERERLVQFDETRHKIVHGNDWSYYSRNRSRRK